MDRRTFLITTTATASLAVISSCDDPTSTSSNNDAGPDIDASDVTDVTDITDVEDVKDTIDASDADGSVEDTRPPTTVKETLVGILEETAQFEDLRDAYGLTKKGPGENWTQRDDIGASAASSGAVVSMSSLAYFAQLTDVHITDEESPARAIHSPFSAESAWRPQEPWTLHMLDSALRTINSFSEVRRHDFVIFSGDVTDNHLGTELRSFLDTVEGGNVNPDTGNDDDPRAAGLNDPHDEFVAAGLAPEIPWYICFGNHDYWALGSVMTSLIADPTSSSATFWLSDAVTPTCFDDPPCPDGYCYSSVPDRCHVPVGEDYYASSSLPADPDRAYLSPEEFVETIMLSSAQGPAGHGFTQENLDSSVYYWYRENAVEGMPVALVALDTTSANSATTDKSGGEISSEQLAWLDDRLTFLEQQNKVIIVVSHHPLNGISTGQSQLASILHNHPNVVLHVVGHGHLNAVYPHGAPSGMDLWHGYWEIQCPSTVDWPQQMRFLEVVDYGDGTGAVYATVVDMQIPSGDVAEAGRFYALLDVHEGRSVDYRRGNIADRNVIMRFAWPPALIPILAALQKRDVESIHFSE
ncbi:metallophosphoesterase [Myxococcota bacterium]|nr:metallophosphoesterase [Myxococcota bacterium]